jgi:hypothetical protein
MTEAMRSRKKSNSFSLLRIREKNKSLIRRKLFASWRKLSKYHYLNSSRRLERARRAKRNLVLGSGFQIIAVVSQSLASVCQKW